MLGLTGPRERRAGGWRIYCGNTTRLRRRAGASARTALAAGATLAAGAVLAALPVSPLAAGQALAVSGLPPTARAAATGARPAAARPPVRMNWLIKSNDLAELRAVGNPGRFQYVACGGLSDPLGCKPGQTPIFTNYYTFRRAVLHGLTGAVVIDYETWSYTPAAQARRPVYWIGRTQQLVRQHPAQRIFTIETPGGRRTGQQLIAEEVAAVRDGSPAVVIQSQFGIWHDKTAFEPFVRRAMRAIRGVHKSVTIMAGLAPDAGGQPVTVHQMVVAYRYALRQGAAGFWLNAAVWVPPRGKGCALEGCPRTVLAFLTAITART